MSFFTSDKQHFHHLLLAKYGSTTKTVGAIYLFNIVLSIVALSTLYLGRAISFPLKLAVLVAVGVIFLLANARRERSEKT